MNMYKTCCLVLCNYILQFRNATLVVSAWQLQFQCRLLTNLAEGDLPTPHCNLHFKSASLRFLPSVWEILWGGRPYSWFTPHFESHNLTNTPTDLELMFLFKVNVISRSVIPFSQKLKAEADLWLGSWVFPASGKMRHFQAGTTANVKGLQTSHTTIRGRSYHYSERGVQCC